MQVQACMSGAFNTGFYSGSLVFRELSTITSGGSVEMFHDGKNVSCPPSNV